MDEGEAVGMEADTADGVGLGTVLEVADNGMVEVLHVDADLVLAASLKFELDEGAVVAALKCVVMGDGETTFLGFRR